MRDQFLEQQRRLRMDFSQPADFISPLWEAIISVVKPRDWTRLTAPAARWPVTRHRPDCPAVETLFISRAGGDIAWPWSSPAGRWQFRRFDRPQFSVVPRTSLFAFWP